MTKRRAFVRVSEDAQLEQIEGIAEQFRAAGAEVTDTDLGRITGQFVVTADEQDVPRLRQQAASINVSFVPEDEDLVHRLPDPSSDLQ